MKVAEHVPRSWLHPEGQKIKAAELAAKLMDRMKGRRGVFVTLTYRRERYNTPGELYEVQRRERHVRRFIEKLEGISGQDLTGKWCRKMEFQSGGWVHFHLVIDVPWIRKAWLDQAWGHGHVWINAAKPERLRYFSKYLAKAGELPDFLLSERARSVRIVASSPGFWPVDGVSSDSLRDKRVQPFYATVGSVLLNRRDSVVVRSDTGWLRLECSLVEVLRFSPSIRREGRWHTVEEVPAAQAAGPPLYLTQSPDPPEWCVDYLRGTGAVR